MGTKLLLLALFMPLALLGCDSLFDSPHPQDDALIREFQTNESDLTRLLEMSNQDAKVIRIAYDFTRLEDHWAWPRPESQLGFSKQRWDEYRALFRKLDLPVGLERAEQKDGIYVYFAVHTRGLGNGHGSSKGYAYLEKELFPLLDSLDEQSVKNYYERERPDHRGTLYRKLKGKWYLFLG